MNEAIKILKVVLKDFRKTHNYSQYGYVEDKPRDVDDGISMCIEELENNNKVKKNTNVTRIKKDIKIKKELVHDDRETRILDFLKNNPKSTNSKIAKNVRIHHSNTKKILNKLYKTGGILSRTKEKRFTYYSLR